MSAIVKTVNALRGRALLDRGVVTGACVAAGSTLVHFGCGRCDWAEGRPDACAVRDGWPRRSQRPDTRTASWRTQPMRVVYDQLGDAVCREKYRRARENADSRG